jgi:hypothetical protein
VITPHALTAGSFSRYAPQARKFSIDNLTVLRNIPLPLLSIVLAQIIEYDTRFPAEQQSLIRQFDYLKSLDAISFKELMAPFAALQLPEGFSSVDWVNQPRRYNEKLSALLWSTHQLDSYRNAGLFYEERLADVLAGKAPTLSRFTIVLVGNGVTQTDRMLFRNLRQHGVLFHAVQPDGALDAILDFVNRRVRSHSQPYGHWYIDGGKPLAGCDSSQGITVMSYEDLAGFAFKELKLMNEFASHSHTPSGPEEVQSFMGSLGPEDLGLAKEPGDAVLHQFQANIFTAAAGTQIFSTTFVQWTAREALRRAQPVTLFARFCPRQKTASMSTLLRRNPLTQEKDPTGSLIDADMGAYYTWINQMRLPGSEQARFLVWFEGHELALAISPSLARGTTSSSPVDMAKILTWMA